VIFEFFNKRLLVAIATISMLAFAASSSHSQGDFKPSDAVRTRLQPIVTGILNAWDKADLICLGEDHGSKNDSDLRIALVEHPDFIRRVKVVMIYGNIKDAKVPADK
jgi:hypothetical protein